MRGRTGASGERAVNQTQNDVNARGAPARGATVCAMTRAARRSGRALTAAVAATLLLLAVLATLQYRWAGELSEAERARLRTGARSRAEAMSREFDLEITRAFSGLAIPPEGPSPGYAERYDAWRRSASYPDDGGRRLRGAPRRRDAPAGPVSPGGARVRRRRMAGRAAGGPRAPGGDDAGRAVRAGAGRAEAGAGPDRRRRVCPRVFPVRPRAGDGRRPDRSPRPFRPDLLTVIALDRDAIVGRILPALAERHFTGGTGLDYDLEIVRQEPPRDVVWRSRPEAPRRADPDAVMGLFDLRFEGVEPGGSRGFGRARAHTEDTGAWRLLVSHRAGPLDDVVAAARRRNLLVSFGVLVLLGASVGLVVASSQRARRLADRQMEFVAAVSHELRTPVAVIRSTSENLADGITRAPGQVREYGAVIRDEAVRLGRHDRARAGVRGHASRGAPRSGRTTWTWRG